ncbi:GPI-anchor transamidase-like [Crassostrea angulata]|uniref:GPI-anchor transamidase-like n=1 Tax=Magallana angulata TaxID=2784310 RepID=UPI0022B13E8C|nr:GPI-anchor transamidase-like [Crassostrea angulata]
MAAPMVNFYFQLIAFAFLHQCAGTSPEEFFKSGHTNNWAVLVDTSRFWFNYRHVANVLSIYRSCKRLGIPDSRIILMVADDMACNPRNPRPATVFNNANNQINVYGDDVEVDYRGYEVTVENFIRVLTGRLPPSTPRSKRLLSDEHSNVLVYMTGHGGDGFLKFQDAEEISNVELADAFEQMWQKRRYHEVFFMIDTCQAESMFQKFYSPNILAVASSKVGEDSLSHHVDPSIGVYVIDRYTYYALEFLETVTPGSKKTMGQFLEVCPKYQCISTVAKRTDLFRRDVNKVLLTDFFGSVRNVELLPDSIHLQNTTLRTHREDSSDVKSDKPLNYAQQFPMPV